MSIEIKSVESVRKGYWGKGTGLREIGSAVMAVQGNIIDVKMKK